jgi:chitin disaccharide deacetylase
VANVAQLSGLCGSFQAEYQVRDRAQSCAIVNADDLGFSPGVTEGIVRAHVEGIVTSTTLMANMPSAQSAIARVRELPELGVGVHLNACQGPPLSREGQRLAGGAVMNWTAQRLILACCLRPSLLGAIEREFDAQIRWALDHGLKPTHLDSHRHLHAFPPLFRRVARLAERHGIRYIRWHRERLPLPRALERGGATASEGDETARRKTVRKQRRISGLLNVFGAVNARMAPQTVGTLGTWGVTHTGYIDSEWLIRVAEAAPEGVIEIMTHPGLAGDVDGPATRLVESRERELAALCDPRVRAAFAHADVKLVHYGQL